MLARAALAGLCSVACAQDLGTGRDLLFSNPGAELPDVYISESVIFTQESAIEAETYTVVLTHPPGMREDETIDLDNDEVRIYLTSSQEHFQQDDAADDDYGTFEERRNHRTQLIVHTNDIDAGTSPGYDSAASTAAAHFGSAVTKAWGQEERGALAPEAGELSGNDAGYQAGLTQEGADGNVAMPLGPLPYIYKTYSTVGGNIPEQQSPLDSTDPAAPQIMVVCPVCTHPAFCVLYDGEPHDLINNPGVATGGAVVGCAPVEAGTTCVLEGWAVLQ